MKHLKKFDNYSLSSEYPDMFEPEKEDDIPKCVPGFDGGTIDPDDDGDTIYNEKSEKEQYEDFKKLVKERNFTETSTEIEINIKKLYHDFYMSIYNPNKHFKEFLYNEIIGKYLLDSVVDFMSGQVYSGIVKKIGYQFDTYSALVAVEFENNTDLQLDNSLCSSVIIIDKLKSVTNKFNI